VEVKSRKSKTVKRGNKEKRKGEKGCQCVFPKEELESKETQWMFWVEERWDGMRSTYKGRG